MGTMKLTLRGGRLVAVDAAGTVRAIFDRHANRTRNGADAATWLRERGVTPQERFARNVMDRYNQLRGPAPADQDPAALEDAAPPAPDDAAPDLGVVAAGLAVCAADTGRALMLQRAMNPTTCPCGTGMAWDGPENGWQHTDGSVSHDGDLAGQSVSDLVGTAPPDPAAGTWEFPGGTLDPGESPLQTAMREWAEEIGTPMPAGDLTGMWASGPYVGYCLQVPTEVDIPINMPADRRTVDNPDDLSETSAWLAPADMPGMPLRSELAASMGSWMPPVMQCCGAGPNVDTEDPTDQQDPTEEPDMAAAGPMMDPSMDPDRRRPTMSIREPARAGQPTAPARVVEDDGLPRAFVAQIGKKTLITTPLTHLGLDQWGDPPNPNPHMSWLTGRYVGADRPNRNGALWTAGDLEFGKPTVALGPVNWLHQERRIMGTIADAKLMPGGRQAAGISPNPHIVVMCGLWDWVYPDELGMIRQASDQGQLFMSMECISDNVMCSGPTGCGQSVPYQAFTEGAGCDHIHQRGAVRRFADPTFFGTGLILPPARPGWPDADTRMLASLSETTYEAAGRPDLPATLWEALTGQLMRFAQL